ncbi:MAG: hypothetical protein ACRBBW_21830 [Cellvibrionaceae bacterium]
MKKLQLSVCIGAALFAAAQTQAAEIKFNGFASVVAGKTLSEGALRNRFTGVESDNTYVADNPTNGVYDDDISFKPDTIFGLQVSADLGKNLSVTGQFTGAGGEDFDTNVAWAYISYDFNENWNMQAGRQRLPLFFYSDFLDVAYAYHWIRVPQSLPAAFNDSFEGIKFAYTNSSDNWDWRIDAYGGASSTEVGGFDIEMEKIMGGVVKLNNDWLQLRATYMTTDIHTVVPTGLSRGGQLQLTKDNPLSYDFAGVAAHATFGNGFLVGEYTMSETGEILGPDFDADGFENNTGWYLSYGHRFGNFTPHITYSSLVADYSDELPSLSSSAEDESDTWTVGVRWDFHPNAAFKFEYATRSNSPDDVLENTVGGFGTGQPREVDIISAGFDIIF